MEPTSPDDRPWRHPSEQGEHDRRRSSLPPLEPPVAIGRGLATATGIISIVFGIVLLLTLLPTRTGQRSPAAATGTAVAVIDGLLGATTLVGSVPSPEPTSPDEASIPTYSLRSDPESAEPVAMAIAIDDGALIITTAAAVGDRREVAIADTSGEIVTASVLLVDVDSGLAVLVPDRVTPLAGLAVANSIAVGDRLTMPGHAADPIAVDDRMLRAVARGRFAFSDDVDEGQPVLNQRGELVGLCTHGSAGPVVLLFDRIDDLRRAIGAIVRPTVWLGVLVESVEGRELVIVSVDPEGPAATAGIIAGEQVLAVNGAQVLSTLELTGALAVHRVGDSVELLLGADDGTTRSVIVELATPPAHL